MKFLLTLLLPFAAISTGHAQIYADFTTSSGNFTCELNYTASPKAVANFIGLAEGSRAWVDPATGAVTIGKPFYDGLTFHRVIKDFMNQCGSRNGLGTDGPGYPFRDEVNNGLVHNAFVLSMANSGKNTNGAQFFITAVPTSWLNGVHTIFGAVTTGQSVITTINNVPTVSDKPVTPVILQTVKIRRVGSAALAFDINAQGLPTVTGRKGTLNVVPGTKTEFIQAAPRTGGSILNIYRSENLGTWQQYTPAYLGKGGTTPSALNLDAATSSKAFYQISEAVIPDAMTPESSANRVITANWGTSPNTFSITFTFDGTGQAGTAVYSGDGTSRAFTLVDYDKSPWAGSWTMNVTGLGGIGFDAVFAAETTPAYTGTHSIYQYKTAGWTLLGNGNVSLSK